MHRSAAWHFVVWEIEAHELHSGSQCVALRHILDQHTTELDLASSWRHHIVLPGGI